MLVSIIKLAWTCKKDQGLFLTNKYAFLISVDKRFNQTEINRPGLETILESVSDIFYSERSTKITKSGQLEIGLFNNTNFGYFSLVLLVLIKSELYSQQVYGFIFKFYFEPYFFEVFLEALKFCSHLEKYFFYFNF